MEGADSAIQVKHTATAAVAVAAAAAAAVTVAITIGHSNITSQGEFC